MSEEAPSEGNSPKSLKSPVAPKGKPRPKGEGAPRKLSLSNALKDANKNALAASVEAKKEAEPNSPASKSSGPPSPSRKVGLPPASKPKAKAGLSPRSPSKKLSSEEEEEEADEEKSQSGSEDESRNKSFSETMSLASYSNRRSTVTVAKLIESVTSKWSHFTEKMVVQLIENEADVNTRLEEPWDRGFDGYVQTLGATTLHFAARRGLLEVIETLLEFRAEVNSSTNLGVSPIMVAVMFDQAEAIKMLFHAKASVLQQDQAGFCAVDLAVLEGKSDILGVIKHCEEEEERIREERVAKEFQLLHKDASDDEDESDFLGSLTSSKQWSDVLDTSQPQLNIAKTGQVGGTDAANLHRSLAPRAQVRADAMAREGIVRSKTSALITSKRGGSGEEKHLLSPASGDSSIDISCPPTPVQSRSLAPSPLQESEDEGRDTFGSEDIMPLRSHTQSDTAVEEGRKNRRFSMLMP